MIKVEGNSVDFEGTGEQLVTDFSVLAYSLIFNNIPYEALAEALVNAITVYERHDSGFSKEVKS